MTPTQLELDLWQELREAELAPERSEPLRLCQGLEQAIASAPPEHQLAYWGDCFCSDCRYLCPESRSFADKLGRDVQR